MTGAPLAVPEERSDTSLIWRNAAAIAVARLGSVVLDGLAYVVTARYFGPAAYGNYLSILVFLNLVDVAADMTIMDITVREMSKEPNQIGLWLTAGTVVRLAIAGIGLAAFTLYVRLSGYSGELLWAAWIGALILPAGALRMPLAVFRARLRMHYELAIVLATRLVNVLLVLWLMYSHAAMHEFFAATAASRFLLAVLSWGAAIGLFHIQLARPGHRLRRLVLESIPMGVSGLFVAFQFRGDILILAHMAGATIAGLYGAIAQLPEYSLYMPVIISTPMLPLLTTSYGEAAPGRFEALYRNMFKSVVTMVIPFAVAAIVLPRAAITFVFGTAFVAVAPILPLIVLSIVGMWVSHVVSITAVAAGLQSNFIRTQSVCLATYLLLNWLLIPRWEITAAATVRLITTALAPTLNYIIVKRRTGISLKIVEIRGSIIAGASMAMIVLLCSRLPFVIAAAMGTAAYAAVLLANSQYDTAFRKGTPCS